MKKLNLLLTVALLCLLTNMMLVKADVNFDQEPTPEERAAFDRMLEPIMKIYNLVKYIATAFAALILLVSGVSYMTSGADPKKREGAKGMVMYVVIGLVIIWAAPIFVGLLVN